MRTFKKAVSVLLALSMVFSLAVTCAFADDPEPDGSEVTEQPAEEEAEQPAEEEAEETEDGIRTLASYSNVTADNETQLRNYMTGTTYSNMDLQITLTNSITLSAPFDDLSNCPNDVRIVGADKNTRLSLGDGVGIMFTSSAMGLGKKITLADLTVNLNGGILMQGLYDDVIEFTLDNVSVGNGVAGAAGLIRLGSLIGGTVPVLTIKDTSFSNCTGALIDTEDQWMECHIENSTLETTASSVSNGQPVIRLIGHAYDGGTGYIDSTVSNSTITWKNGDNGEAFSCGIELDSTERLTLSDETLLSGPDDAGYAVTLGSGNTDLVLEGCTFGNEDDSLPVIACTASGSVVELGSSFVGEVKVLFNGLVNSYGHLQINSALSEKAKIYFGYGFDFSGYSLTLATAGDGYEITEDDMARLEYNGIAYAPNVLMLEDNTIMYNKGRPESSVTDGPSFKQACEYDYGDVDYVTVSLAADIPLSSEDLIEAVRVSNLIIDGTREDGGCYTLSMPEGYDTGSLTLFNYQSLGTDNVVLQNVNIEANGQQLLNARTSTAGSVTLENVSISGLGGTGITYYNSSGSSSAPLNLTDVTCDSCDGTFLEVSRGRTVNITDCSLTAAARQDGDAVIYAPGGTNNTEITIEDSTITMDDNDFTAYGIRTGTYCGLTLEGSTVSAANNSGSTWAVYFATDRAFYSYEKLTINSCEIAGGEGDARAVIRLETDTDDESYYPALQTDGQLTGNPLVSLSEKGKISLSDHLADTVYFDYYHESTENMVLAEGKSGCLLTEDDLEKLVCADPDSVRILLLDEGSNQILFCRSENAVEVHVRNAEELYNAVTDTKYSAFVQEVIYLDNSFQMTDDYLIDTKPACDDVIIDGQPAGNDGDPYVLTGPSGSDSQYVLFSLGELDGYGLVFRNLTIDGNGQRLISSGAMALSFENVTLLNLHGSVTSTNQSAIYFSAAGGSLSFTDSVTEGCTGSLIYLNQNTETIVDHSTLATTAVSGGSCNYVISMAAGTAAVEPKLLFTNGSTLSITDSEDVSGEGIHNLNSYWNATFEGGSRITGTNASGNTCAISVNSSLAVLNLNDCVFENTDGTQPVVNLSQSSFSISVTYWLHTNGQCQGALIRLQGNSYSNSSYTPILISGELQYDMKFTGRDEDYFESGTIGHYDPYIATGEDGYDVSDTDAEHLIYVLNSGEETARETGVEDGYVRLYRVDLADCDVVFTDEPDGYDSDGVPYYYATYQMGAVDPAVEIRDSAGKVYTPLEDGVTRYDYTLKYTNDTVSSSDEGLKEYNAAATIQVADNTNAYGHLTDKNNAGAELPYTLIVRIDITARGFEFWLNYDEDTDTWSTELYNGTQLLTEGEDYSVEYVLDEEDYKMTAIATGINGYIGELSDSVSLPGRSEHVTDVNSEEALNNALAGDIERIDITRDIEVDDPVVVDRDVTIDGGGHSLIAYARSGHDMYTPVPYEDGTGAMQSFKDTAVLSVTNGAQLVVEDLTVNGSDQARCLYVGPDSAAELKDGSVLTGGGWKIDTDDDTWSNAADCGIGIYADEGSTVTLTDCEVKDILDENSVACLCGIIRNFGTLNVGEDAVLTSLGTEYAAVRNEGELNWDGGIFNVNEEDAAWYGNGGADYTGTVIENDGTFSLTGGRIDGTTADGGYTTATFGAVANYGEMNMTGGCITGFSAPAPDDGVSGGVIPGGGGIRNVTGALTLSGGEITGNTAGLGGGVYNDHDSVFTLTGGAEISGNSAGLGGGVFNMSPLAAEEGSAGAVFEMDGGAITGNKLTGNEITVDPDAHAASGAASSLSNAGSAVCAAGGSTVIISGGTVTGEETASVTLTDEEGNESSKEIRAGIVLDSAFSFGNDGTDYAVQDDAAMTVTGDPDIEVGIVLVNLETVTQDACLNDPDNTDDRTDEGDPVTSERWSWLWLDGALTASLDLSSLDLLSYKVHWTNSDPVPAGDLCETTAARNGDRDVFAFYQEGVEPNEEDGQLLVVEDETLRQLPFYEEREDGTVFDYEAWQICDHTVTGDIEYVAEVPATCVDEGVAEHYVCTYCGLLFRDAACTEEVTEDDLIIQAKGHSWVEVPEVPATETTEGWTSYIACSVCGVHDTEPEPIAKTVKTELNAEISEAESLNQNDYTADSWASLQSALDSAKAVQSYEYATQDEIDDAVKALAQAVDGLKKNSSTGSFTGFASNEGDGNWYYYRNGKIATDVTTVMEGTVKDSNGWWYVVSGKVQLDYSGVCDYSNEYGWWYVDNGRVNFNKNSVEQNKYGWWYVTGGKVQFGYTGVSDYPNAYGYWYIKDGKVDFSKTGIEPNSYGWWRVVGGKVDFSCNSVEQNDYGWWYLVGGKVQFGYTGVADYSNAYGWWYVKDGKVDFSKTGIEPNKYGWWRVVSGKVDFSCNSVEQNDYGWWYLVGGKVDFSYTGVSDYGNAYGYWYIRDGKVDFSVNSVEQNRYGWWYVLGGKVQFGYTGVADYANAYGWWYISKGKVDFGYTGRASNSYGTWNVVDGKVVF